MKDKPSAFSMLVLSLLIWTLPLFALLNAATGDCVEPQCPSEGARAAPIFIAATVSLVLQFLAVRWYARSHYRD